MNGQQLTNSSNSANCTPSSSYPASLSSESSRDPSPATRPGVPRKPLPADYNHVISAQTNHWPKDKSELVDPAPLRHSPQINHSTPIASPASTTPVSSVIQPQLPESQGLHTTMAQSAAGVYPNQQRPFSPSMKQQSVAPSSQPIYRFPPATSLPQPLPPSTVHSSIPSSQTNHLPQSISSLPNQFTTPAKPSSMTYSSTQPTEPRTVQSLPQQTSSQLQTQSSFQSFPNSQPQQQQHLSQFQRPSSAPYQQQPNQFQTRPPSQGSQQAFYQQPNQVTQIPNQISQNNQLSNSLNQVSQPPNQIQQLPNKFSGQPNQPSQLPNQIHQQQNKIPGPLNQAMQPSTQNKIAGPSSHMAQPTNQFPQPHSQFTQPLNQPYKPQNQIITQPPFPQNQFVQPPQQVPNQTFTQQPQLVNATGPTPQHQYSGSGYSQPFHTQQIPNQFNKRYPQMQTHPGPMDNLSSHMSGMSVQQGFNKLWGMDAVDLLQCRELLPKEKIEPPAVRLQQELYEAANCSPEIFRCTLTKIPETKSLLDKSRLPLGVLIHPFKDLNDVTDDTEESDMSGQWQQRKNSQQLSVIQCTVIVRCRMCRTYINPFVYFVDNKRWKCNLCFRVNELPDEFQFDPMTKTYGDPSRRPEIKSATIEFIAPSEYMVRPPQPATYVFVFDVSRLACECGYLDAVCRTLLRELDNLPGDARTSVAFITFDSSVHFYSLTEGQGQPHEMVVVDIDDMFLPTPDNLLVSLNECRDLIRDLLQELPNKYRESFDTHSALGAALQAAYKLLAPTGGRVTVFQACLPNAGPGALSAREDPAQRAGDNPPHLNPSTDFYKKLALDCSGQQIAVDLFLVNSQYLDLATLSGVSRFSGGCMHHIPLYRSDKPLLVDTLERMFQRYLIRKIGFESVMRLRCTRGLSIHTFHGNFFVRSTDLLSLPNANPDAGFGMQVTIDENLTDVQNVCFQAALLYTSSKGERRIRVHTLCLPVASSLPDILHSADQQCIVGLLAKMAVDRAVQSSLSDAREAFVNVVADILSAYKLTQSGNTAGCMLAPGSLRLLPTYILALLKHVAFRVGQSTRLDDRVFAMCQMKSLPLTFLMQSVYPDLYALLNIEQQPEVEIGDITVPQPPRLQLSAERIDSHGLFLMDDGSILLMYVGHNLNPAVCQAVFDVPNFSAIPQELYTLPDLDNPTSSALKNFVSYLQNEKPYPTPLQVIRDDSHQRMRFIERLIEDKNESGTSYYEFLQRVKSLVK